MAMGNTRQTWGWVTKVLHWLVVILVVNQLFVGFLFATLSPEDTLWRRIFAVHTSIGLTILFLMTFRLVWRLLYPVPELPDTLAPWQKVLARTHHYFFYLILIAMPVVGYLLVNAYGQPATFWGIEMPVLIGENEDLQKQLSLIHAIAAFVLIAAIAVHVAAALRHHYKLKDNVLRRMLSSG
jgi:cytochrome b561